MQVVVGPAADRGQPASQQQQEEEDAAAAAAAADADAEPLTEEDIAQLREELEQRLALADRGARRPDGSLSVEEAGELWAGFMAITGELSQRLCEQLRLLLEPQLATKLQARCRRPPPRHARAFSPVAVAAAG